MRISIRAASLALLAAAPLAQKLDFERLEIPLGTSPSDVGIADFDLDGLHDVVTTDPVGGRILVLLQRPGRTFVLRSFPVGDRPARLVAADLDGSPGPDVAVVHAGSEPAELWILRGDGTGSFAVSDVLTLPGDVRDLVAADVDQDGDVDLVTTHFAAQQLRILRGAGDGTFPAVTRFATAGNPTWADVGDVNGDGFVDILFVQWLLGGTTDLLGGPGGQFTPGPGINTGVVPDWVHLGDMNGDGCLDMTSHALIYQDGAEIWLGGNYPNFQLLSLWPPNAKGIYADMDGDGRADHVSNAFGLETRIGLGTGQFLAPQTFPACGSVPHVADLDADGRLDVVEFCSASERIQVFWGREGKPPVITGITPAFLPTLAQEGDGVTIEGDYFSQVKSVKVGILKAKPAGASASNAFPKYEVLDEQRIFLRPFLLPYPTSPKPIEITTEFGTTTQSFPVGTPPSPVLNPLDDKSTQQDVVKLWVGAPPGDFLLLLVSPSPTATTIPGVLELGIGAGGTSLFLLWSGTISGNGWDPLLIFLPDGLNLQTWFQALSLGDGSLPLPVSPVLTKLLTS